MLRKKDAFTSLTRGRECLTTTLVTKRIKKVKTGKKRAFIGRNVAFVEKTINEIGDRRDFIS